MKKLKYHSTMSLFFLSLITLGIYSAYYIKRQTKILNEFKPNIPISDFFVNAIIIFSYIGAIINVILAVKAYIESGIWHAADSFSTNYFSFGTLIPIWAFLARDRIQEYLDCNGDENKRFCGIMTLIFGVFYINHKINDLIEDNSIDEKYLEISKETNCH